MRILADEHGSSTGSPHIRAVRILTDSVLQKENKRAWATSRTVHCPCETRLLIQPRRPKPHCHLSRGGQDLADVVLELPAGEGDAAGRGVGLELRHIDLEGAQSEVIRAI